MNKGVRSEVSSSRKLANRTILTLSICASCLEISGYFIRVAIVPLLRSCHVNVLALGMDKVRFCLSIMAT